MAQQMYLVVQSLLATPITDSSRDPLMALMSYLRRQYNLLSDMAMTCTTVSTPQWPSLGQCTNWMFRHHEPVCRFWLKKDASVNLCDLWWMFAAGLEVFISAVDQYLKYIQGKSTLGIEQRARIDALLELLQKWFQSEDP